jgi:hypothetical protein
MPERKYWTNAERQAAYRKRQRLKRELTLAELPGELNELREEIRRRRKAAKGKWGAEKPESDTRRKSKLNELLDYIDSELYRLTVKP